MESRGLDSRSMGIPTRGKGGNKPEEVKDLLAWKLSGKRNRNNFIKKTRTVMSALHNKHKNEMIQSYIKRRKTKKRLKGRKMQHKKLQHVYVIILR